MGFDLMPIDFSEATLHFETNAGKMEVTKGLFVSDDITAEVDGHIQLMKRIERSRLRLTVTLELGKVGTDSQLVHSLNRTNATILMCSIMSERSSRHG